MEGSRNIPGSHTVSNNRTWQKWLQTTSLYPNIKICLWLNLPPNAHNHFNTTRVEGTEGKLGWKRDSGLNHLWLKYPSFANFITTYHHVNTLPGPLLGLERNLSKWGALKLTLTDFLANWPQPPLLSTSSKPSSTLSWTVAITSSFFPAPFSLFLTQCPKRSCKNLSQIMSHLCSKASNVFRSKFQ